MNQLSTDRVAPYPWPRHRKLDYQLSIDIFQFLGTPGDQVTLSGVWSLLDGEGRIEHEIQRFRIDQPVQGTQLADVAAALSGALGILSEQLAQAITAKAKALEK